MIGRKSGTRNGVDLRQRGKLRIERTRRLLASRIWRNRATWTKAGAERRLVDVKQLQLVDAVIPHVSNLKDQLVTQLLLDIKIPGLGVGRSQIVLDARNVKRRLRRTGSKDRNSHS